jgi:hypothetical protein
VGHGNHRSLRASRWGKHFTGYDAFETCDWDAGHRGPRPRYWRCVKDGACDWLVNDSLALADAALPGRRCGKQRRSATPNSTATNESASHDATKTRHHMNDEYQQA